MFFLKFNVLLLISLVGIRAEGQDLKLVTNIGHRSTIVHFEEGLNGATLFSGSESEIIKRETRSGRILFKYMANGKFMGMSLSEDKKTLTAFENTKNGHFIHLWN